MRGSRFSIGGVMVAVVLIALNCATIRLLSRQWFLFGELFAVGALPMANVLAIGLMRLVRMPPRSRPGRPFLNGFVAFGMTALASYIAWAWFGPRSVNNTLDWALGPVRDAMELSLRGWSLPLFIALVAAVILIPQVAFALLGGWLSSRYRLVLVLVLVRRHTDDPRSIPPTTEGRDPIGARFEIGGAP